MLLLTVLTAVTASHDIHESGTFRSEISLVCEMQPATLRVNGLERPLGVPTDKPVFSWAFTTAGPNARKNQSQSAYQIKCTSAGKLL